MQTFTSLDGALLVDKPAGWTSHDVVARIRGQFRLRKVGHCGTLDPSATGLLVLVLGQATRLAEKFMSSDKVYEGTFRLGITTDSQDADGAVLSTAPVPALTGEDLARQAETFLGDQHQLPPMVSAVKVGGVPLYKLARKGQEIERTPRLIHVYAFRITRYEEPDAAFRLACTKGTYVRTIVHDLGQQLGCGAHLTSLRRLASGKFDLVDAHPLESILQWSPTELSAHVLPFLKLRTYE